VLYLLRAAPLSARHLTRGTRGQGSARLHVRRHAPLSHHGRRSSAGAGCPRAAAFSAPVALTLSRRAAQPAVLWKLWVKQSGGGLCKLKGVDPVCDVYDVAERWAGELQLDVHPSRIELRKLKVGPGVPTESEEAAAKLRDPLQSSLPLCSAGVEDGHVLLADITTAQGSLGGAHAPELLAARTAGRTSCHVCASRSL